MSEAVESFPPTLSRAQEEVIAYFCDGVRVLGLPKSIGEIYGILFISPEPLSLDGLVEKLDMSKGSASQGLKFLRNLGAIHRQEVERKSYYSPELNLKSLVGGFIKEEIRPHMKSGEEKLAQIKTQIEKEKEEATAEFYEERFEKMQRWTKQAKVVLPLLQHVLNS